MFTHTYISLYIGSVVVGIATFNCGTTMVHTVFKWRYGGHRVSLYGSFSGRAEIRMILVEGSSMIFQTICDLPVGYHQFKFLVDGVWRFDDQKLCGQDEYGTINNIIIVEELELISPTFRDEAFQRSLDMENDRIMQHAASSSDGLHHEPVLRLLDNEIDVSLHCVLMHLSSYKTYELIPNSGKVFGLDVEMALKDAFHVMYKEGVATLPLWDDSSQQIAGMLTASDFILILIELHKTHAILSDEQLNMHTISAWKLGKSPPHVEVDGAMLSLYRRPLIQAGPDESLKEVALRILQHKISTVPLLHTAEDGFCPELLHIACLAGILKHICRYFRICLQDLPLLQQPVCNLPLGTWTREVGRASGRLLLTLHPTQISSIPIVNDDGALLNVYSHSDIISLVKGNVYARIQLDQTIMSQALELVDETTLGRYQTCTRSDTLYMVMERLSNPVVRRIVVIESGSLKVEGIITLRDVFNLILS